MTSGLLRGDANLQPANFLQFCVSIRSARWTVVLLQLSVAVFFKRMKMGVWGGGLQKWLKSSAAVSSHSVRSLSTNRTDATLADCS